MSTLEERMSEFNDKWTWIRVKNGTKNRIAKRGRKDQTFEDIIKDLLDHAEAL